MEKRFMEILEVKHLIALLVTVHMLGIIVYIITSSNNLELVNRVLEILNNAFTIILGYLFGRQKHLDVNKNTDKIE